MIHPETETVTVENGIAPAGKPDRCFWCGAQLGQPHEPDCVCRKKTVVIIFTAQMVIDLPESWSVREAECYMDKSGYCLNNICAELDKAVPCACHWGKVKVIRDATEGDEINWYGKVVDLSRQE